MDSCVGFDVEPFDTILLHNIAFPEYKHDLSFVTSVWGEPGRAWKTDREGRKNALEAETDQELHTYCAKDVSNTHSLVEPLLNLIYEREQQHIIPLSHTVQRICGEMHANGMWVDQAKRKEVERLCIQKLNHGYKAKNKQTGEIEWVPGYLQQLRQLSGKPDLNPGSTAQLRTVLFEDGWRLEPPFSEDDEEMAYTESGDRSTSDVVIRALLKLETNGQLLPHQALFLKVLRTYRSEQKMLGTYIAKLRSADEVVDVGWDDDDDENERAYREEKNLSKRGVVWPDGRMRPGYNAHVALCVDLSTWIITQNGPRRIGDLEGYGPAQTERPAQGLRLHDGHAFAEVSHLQNPGVCATLRMVTALGIELIATPHHQIQIAPPAVSGGRREKFRDAGEPAPVWCRMDALTEDDHVLIPIGMDTWATTVPVLPLLDPVCPQRVTEDLAHFAGLFNARGALRGLEGHQALWIIDAPRPKAAERLALSLFGPDAVQLSAMGVRVKAAGIVAWMEVLGLMGYVGDRGIPWWVQASPRSVVVAYLKGLACRSVCTGSRTTLSWMYQGTERLCREVQVLLLNFGIVAGVYDQTTETNSRLWSLQANGDECRAVCALLGLRVPEGATGKSAQRHYTRRGNHLWLLVKAVEDSGLRPVRDVTIPTTHQFWANGTVSHNTGRLSSSKPLNAQNVPKSLRTLIRAGPGHILIGADADQIEFRIGAAWWGVTKYLKAFEAGADPHSTTALACFGDAFLKADGFPGGHWEDGLFFPNGEGDWTGSAYDQRTLGKRIQFNGQYKGSPETMCRVIQEGENDAGELIYLDMTEDRVRYLYQNWKAGIPEMERGWNRDIAFFRKHKYIADPVIGRRRYCPNGENPNEIVNFPIQCAAAALINRAMIRLAKLIPFEKWGPGTGLIGQVHDWLGLEVPDTGVTVEEKLNKKGKKVFVYHVAPRTPAAEAMAAMTEVMNFTEPSLPGVRFTSGAKIGYTWKEVG